MKQGSWISIITIYLFGVLAVAGLGRILPLNTAFNVVFGLNDIQFAWVIGLVGFPALLLSIPLGMLVDNFGPKKIILFGAFAGIIANIFFGTAHGMFGLQLGRIFDGIAISSIFSSGPAILMATTQGKKQIAAMTLWSTCPPVGFSIGLMLGGKFADAAHWQFVFLFHGLSLLFVIIIGLFIAKDNNNKNNVLSLKNRISELVLAYKNVPLLIFVLGYLFNASLGFGANSVLPIFISKTRNMEIFQASQLVAGTSLFMILGSLGIGALLAKNLAPKKLELGIALMAIMAGFFVFYPKIPISILPIFLVAWFLSMGGSTTILMSSLPKFSEAGRMGASSGLVNQASSISTIITPQVWFGMMGQNVWIYFPLMIVFYFTMIASTIWVIYTWQEKKV